MFERVTEDLSRAAGDMNPQGTARYVSRRRSHNILFSCREPLRGDVIFEGWFQAFPCKRRQNIRVSPREALQKSVFTSKL